MIMSFSTKASASARASRRDVMQRLIAQFAIDEGALAARAQA